MIPQVFTVLLFPILSLAAPAIHIAAREAAATCTPSSYTISAYTLSATPPNQSVHLVFHSTFPDPSTVSDAAISGSICDATSDTNGAFPNELTCSTGRGNVEVDLRSAAGSGKYQVIHFWKCAGKNWMSSTPVDLDPSRGEKAFQPQNVHEVPCGAPTCA